MKRPILFQSCVALALTTGAAQPALPPEVISFFPMTVTDGTITDEATGATFSVRSQLPAFSIEGVRGEAMRFDGYSNYVTARWASETQLTEMTLSLWCAVETYPMMTAEAEDVATFTTLVGNLDEAAKTGLSLMLSSKGDLKVATYSGGWPVSLTASTRLSRNRWNHLAVTLSADRKLRLYLNGEEIGQSNTTGSITPGKADLTIGKSPETIMNGRFHRNTFCGLMDDLTLLKTALTPEEIKAEAVTDLTPDFNYPATRYAESLWRPAFHGMPSGGWTNECHGMVKSDGRYHLFFQKNANGPYMSRLHWGHISSANLYDWHEEPIALAPEENYDIKGCWSGCVFTDEALTGGVPRIYYTAVDNAKATICSASPLSDDLLTWEKAENNPLIAGRPQGLSDDFRDPYLFTANGKHYMIVGTSRNNVGATTLHRYEQGTWTNDGAIFFNAASKNVSGRFWEMPNVTPLAGKYLFTVTPLETAVGVETQYWVGDIQSDGTFRPLYNDPQKVELDGFSRDGYGLLSPTILNDNGRTIALGIVPDKLPAERNAEMGWAHNYSLPREWSLDSDYRLVQKPVEELKQIRETTAFAQDDFLLSEALQLGEVRGRCVEVIGEFEVGTASKFGFRFFEKDGRGMTLSYAPSTGLLTLDMQQLERVSNDDWSYNGLYSSALPEPLTPGETLKIHAFIDRSIIDFFINDRYAASVRMFPTDVDAEGVQVFSEGATTVKSVKAWTLKPGTSASISAPEVSHDLGRLKVENGRLSYQQVKEGTQLFVYSLSGVQLLSARLVRAGGQVDFPFSKGSYLALLKKGTQQSMLKFAI